MKCFHCEGCGMMVFFENNRCLKCGKSLGFLPDILNLSTLELTPKNQWQAGSPWAAGRNYRNCNNGQMFQACNWMVRDNDPSQFCVACSLNEIIPDLTQDKNLGRWKQLEQAKRRCLYTLLKLGLPVGGSASGGQPALRFRFLQDQANSPVITGHQNGVITLNIAEADDDEREQRRLNLNEPNRTLVGHMRHETGHFYWDYLIANSSNLPRFRELFGDENANYGAALQAYYQQGPPANWRERFVTAYAGSHPWEDWAETWAHYLHILDTLETAANFGLNVNPENITNPPTGSRFPIIYSEQVDFDQLLASWISLTGALNSIKRGMGLADPYPGAIPPTVIQKLRFIHRVIKTVRPNVPDHYTPHRADWR